MQIHAVKYHIDRGKKSKYILKTKFVWKNYPIKHLKEVLLTN